MVTWAVHQMIKVWLKTTAKSDSLSQHVDSSIPCTFALIEYTLPANLHTLIKSVESQLLVKDFIDCVNATYTLSYHRGFRCCNFNSHRYDTDGSVSDSMRTNTQNYQPLFGTEQNSRLERPEQASRDVTETRNFTRPSDSQGFYLAFRDPGTCGIVNRIIVYYRVLPGRSDTLTSCPAVPLPVIGNGRSSSRSCTCLGNSSEVRDGDLERICDQNGMCTDGGSCKCDAGFTFDYDTDMCVGRYNLFYLD